MEAVLYFHTLRHLRPGQFYHRLRLKLSQPSPDLRPAPAFRRKVAEPVPFPSRPSRMVGRDTFRFLNEEGSLGEGWSPPGRSKLWCYHLHYFDDLNADSAFERAEWHQQLLQRWVAENPPAEGVGWEPYPTSLRIVNWIKYALRGGLLPPEAVESLAVQARWLERRLELHLLGNHLLANAKALLFAGLFFEGDEAGRWYEQGRGILKRELAEQVLPDGGHFERSPMYHLVVLEDVLDVLNLHQSYGWGAPDAWFDAARRMQDWSRVMRHPDGGVPFFNDTTFGVAPEPAELDSYGEALGVPVGECLGEGGLYLEDSGFCRVQRGEAVLFADVGSVGPAYLPGHSHAETLSFELSLGGRRVLVNSGISEYGVGKERLRQRGTKAHNALSLDGSDSSEVWSGFRVARRARVGEVTVGEEADGSLHVRASHDGFRRLPGNPRHRRHFSLTSRGLSVLDEVSGRGSHTMATFWHLHPEMAFVEAGPDGVVGPDGARVLDLDLDPSMDWNVEPVCFHPGFGVSQATERLCGSTTGGLPQRFQSDFYFSGRD